MRLLFALLALFVVSCSEASFGFISRPDPGYCAGPADCPADARCHMALHYCYVPSVVDPVFDPYTDLEGAQPVQCSVEDRVPWV